MEQVNLELNLDTKAATVSAKDMAKAMDNLAESTDDADKSLSNLDNEAKSTGRSLNELEGELDNVLDRLKEAEVGSQTFKELATEASNLKTEIANAELAFETLDLEQRMTAGLDAIGGVAGGFAAVQGSIALAGVESAEFEETMIKVQAAMALSTGIRDIGTAVAAMQKLNIATRIQLGLSKAAGVAQGIWNAITLVGTTIQQVFNTVLTANPIGIIVVAIAALIAGLILLAKNIKTVIKVALLPFIVQIELAKRAIEAVGQALGLLPSEAEKAAKAERELAKEQIEASQKAAKQKIKDIEEVANKRRKDFAETQLLLDREIELAEARGEDTKKLRLEQLQNAVDNAYSETEEIRQQGEERVKIAELEAEKRRLIAIDSDRWQDKLLAAGNKAFIESEKEKTRVANEEAEKRRKEAEHNQRVEEERQEAARKKEAKDNAKAAADRIKREREAEKKLQEELAKLRDEAERRRIDLIENEEERELAKLDYQLEQERKRIEASVASEELRQKLLSQINEQGNNDRNEINSKYRKQEKEAQEKADEKKRQRIQEQWEQEQGILNSQFEERQRQHDRRFAQEEEFYNERMDQINAQEEDRKTLEEERFQLQQDELRNQLEQKLLTQAEYDNLEAIQAQDHQDLLTDIESQATEQRTAKAIEEAEKRSQGIQMIEEGLVNTLRNLTQIAVRDAEKAEKIQKAIALTQLAIDTAKSISAVVAGATQAAAAGGPAAPFLLAGYIASGLATVTGAIAQAKSILGESGGEDIGAIGAGAPTTPQGVDINSVDNGSTIIPDTNDEPDKRVFVLETDITNSQNNIVNIEDTATIN